MISLDDCISVVLLDAFLYANVCIFQTYVLNNNRFFNKSQDIYIFALGIHCRNILIIIDFTTILLNGKYFKINLIVFCCLNA